jgi:hypothetical protein
MKPGTWRANAQATPERGTTHFTLYAGEKVLSFSEVITGWKTDATFRAFFNGLLAQAPYAAFFWETPPVRQATTTAPFAFVLVDSEHLAGTTADPAPFRAHFEAGKPVVGFGNLGGDAYLVVPCPLGTQTCYAHLAAFVRNAPPDQQDALWRCIGEAYERQLSTAPKWLSTAGLGVSWLHVRIDSRPKYYRYKPYKEIDAQ